MITGEEAKTNIIVFSLIRQGLEPTTYRDEHANYYMRNAILIVNEIKWLSDCCLTPIQQFVSYIMERTS